MMHAVSADDRRGERNLSMAVVFDDLERNLATPAAGWTVLTGGLEVFVEVAVVIPCVNEALNLPAVLSQMPPTVTEVIIVDGNSTDDTVAIAREIRPDAVIVHQSGKARATPSAPGSKRPAPTSS
jgi:hypothetical protein